MTAPPAPSTHHLLLALAGRVDDDLLATARELVAIGEEPQALEILVATLVADRTALPALLRSEVVELARRRAIELDADGLLAPAAGSLDGTRHVFGAGPTGADERLAGLLTSPPGSTMRVAWRMTPAGAAPGPVPHPVVLVELAGPGIAPEVVSYRLGAHLLRSGLPASVEAYTPADALPAYQRAALERAWEIGARGGLPTGAQGGAHGPAGPGASGFPGTPVGETPAAAPAAGSAAPGVGASGSDEAAAGSEAARAVSAAGSGASGFGEPGVGTAPETSGGAVVATSGAAARDMASTGASGVPHAARTGGPAADRVEEAPGRPSAPRPTHGTVEPGPRPSPSPRPAPADPGTPPPLPRPLLGRPLTTSQPPAAFRPLGPGPQAPEGVPSGASGPGGTGPLTDGPGPRPVPSPGPRLGPVETGGPEDEPRTSPFGRTHAPRSRPTLSVVPPAPGHEPPSGPRQTPGTRPTPVVRTEDSLPTPARPWAVSREEAEETDPPVLASMRDPLSGPLHEPLLDAQLDRAETGPVPVVGLTPPQGTPAVDEAARPGEDAGPTVDEPSAPAASAPVTGRRRRRAEEREPAPEWTRDWASGAWAMPTTGRRCASDLPAAGAARAGEDSGSAPESPSAAHDATDPTRRPRSADLQGPSEDADLSASASVSAPGPGSGDDAIGPTAQRSVPEAGPSEVERDAERPSEASAMQDGEVPQAIGPVLNPGLGEAGRPRSAADSSPPLEGRQPPAPETPGGALFGPADSAGGRRRRPEPDLTTDETDAPSAAADSAGGRRRRPEPDLTTDETDAPSAAADSAGGRRRPPERRSETRALFGGPDLGEGPAASSDPFGSRDARAVGAGPSDPARSDAASGPRTNGSADPLGGPRGFDLLGRANGIADTSRRDAESTEGRTDLHLDEPARGAPHDGPTDSAGNAVTDRLSGTARPAGTPDGREGFTDAATAKLGAVRTEEQPLAGHRSPIDPSDPLGAGDAHRGEDDRTGHDRPTAVPGTHDRPGSRSESGEGEAGLDRDLPGFPDGDPPGSSPRDPLTGPSGDEGMPGAPLEGGPRRPSPGGDASHPRRDTFGALFGGSAHRPGPDEAAPGPYPGAGTRDLEPDTPDPATGDDTVGSQRRNGSAGSFLRTDDLGSPSGPSAGPASAESVAGPQSADGAPGSPTIGSTADPSSAGAAGPHSTGSVSGSPAGGAPGSSATDSTTGSPAAGDLTGPSGETPAASPRGSASAGRPGPDPSSTECPAHAQADGTGDDAPTGRRAARDGMPTIRPVPGGRRRARHRPDDAEPDPWNFAADAGDAAPEPAPRPEEDPQDRSDGLPPPRPVPRTIPRIRRTSDQPVSGLFGPGEVPPSRPDDPFGTGPGPARGRSEDEPLDDATASTEPAGPDTAAGAYSSLSSREQDLLRLLQQELAVRETPPERRNGSGPHGPPDLAG
ncbi:hypothetical protein LWC35_30780 [Pseudonocardia kujensis]|uniref:hypothetical protein n=1 Tax=Pseudonocardia kujensis TaxID=1128675 RepID=UPI001E52C204|nr:hypothetical protein [Pseudonocardia kujensis]MCE0767257.1 hypothetical protein [Pseudonocardia kujensis]